jgi:hypothetical protein
MAAESAGIPSFFTPTQREFLAYILNRIVPASGNFPGAGTLGVAAYLDVVVGPVADLKRLFAQGLAQIAIASQTQYGQEFADVSDDQKDVVLRQVEIANPAFFEALVQHTYSGYYSHPTAIRLLGLEVWPPQPRGHHLEPFDLGLLDHRQQRGPLYRQA